MTDSPIYPLILADKSGYLDVIQNKEHLGKTNVLGFLKGSYKKFTAFDGGGNTWIVNQLRTNYPINGVTKFLAHTIYNPCIDVTFQWQKGKMYKIEDLKKTIAKLIDLDDDVLTQYEEPKIIKNKLYICESFESIVSILRKDIFNANE